MNGFRVPPIKRRLAEFTAQTTSSDTGAIVLTDTAFDNLLLKLDVSAFTGTTPTFDCYLQQSLDGGSTYVDVARFAQLTAATTNSHYVNLSTAGTNSVVGAVGDATISASSIGTQLTSNVLRVRFVLGGTTPSITFSLDSFAV